MLAAIVVICLAVGQGTNQLALAATIIIFPAAIALYFHSSIVAFGRGRPNAVSIFLLNLFLAGRSIWLGCGAGLGPAHRRRKGRSKMREAKLR